MANNQRKISLLVSFLFSVSLSCLCLSPIPASARRQELRFGANGEFKILQVADMHFANGATTPCLDVLPSQIAHCSDLNTTTFMSRVIAAEKPDLIVFTGDNIFGSDAKDAVKSLNAAFAPAIESKIPWVAVLGNHDQESTLTRQGLMNHIVKLPNTLSQVNPPEAAHYIDGFGNYNLKVHGAADSNLQNKSILNLYFLDSGDYSSVPSLKSKYDWVKTSQQFWFDRTSKRLQKEYNAKPNPQQGKAPGLAYFHIPLPEFWSFDSKNATKGVRQEGTSAACTNSGFFTTLVARGDVKSVFVGHDHTNDFCGELKGLNLCYGGGFGYHAYGKAGWERRARVVVVDLNKKRKDTWGDVKSIRTWKRLDDKHLSVIDSQVLWNSSANGLVAPRL
ncbi:PREDICTED: probable inactive purple acid phosphatase 29 [Camelina sativa]|uniref:Probable inactive purple acid phosphatase 29 n=1 Tax=Camelina sativa TaxID=90675 RepID=A0ABM0UPK3_CAMSA|nr:PREDICTED: probable inactive purple acid phosphatase 29 [Camelina sativa]